MPAYGQNVTLIARIVDMERRIGILETTPRSAASGTSGLMMAPLMRLAAAPVVTGLSMVTIENDGWSLDTSGGTQVLSLSVPDNWVIDRDPYGSGNSGPLVYAGDSGPSPSVAGWYTTSLAIELEFTENPPDHVKVGLSGNASATTLEVTRLSPVYSSHVLDVITLAAYYYDGQIDSHISAWIEWTDTGIDRSQLTVSGQLLLYRA